MGIKKRQYSREFKEEIVQKNTKRKSVLELGKENNISPGVLTVGRDSIWGED
jgi:transposase-like protein